MREEHLSRANAGRGTRVKERHQTDMQEEGRGGTVEASVGRSRPIEIGGRELDSYGEWSDGEEEGDSLEIDGGYVCSVYTARMIVEWLSGEIGGSRLVR